VTLDCTQLHIKILSDAVMGSDGWRIGICDAANAKQQLGEIGAGNCDALLTGK